VISFDRYGIPVVTLPDIRSLLFSIFTRQSSGEIWCNSRQKASFYRGSAWGISEAVKTLLKSKGKTHGIVFLPDYFCNQALRPLRFQSVQLVFYPVTENLNPDWRLLHALVLLNGKPDVFILVHYFGFPGEIRNALQFCQQVGAVLLEDGAHVLMPIGEIGKFSWASVFSPYKLLPVPKLGVLVTSKETEISCEMSGEKKRVDMETCKWVGKRVLQSLFLNCGISWRGSEIVPFDSDAESNFERNSSVSAVTLQMLKMTESKLDQYKRIRRRHYKIVEEGLSVKNDVARPFFSSLPEDVCPYLFPMWLHESIIEDVYYRLNRMGVPVQTWPDLPPEVKEKPSTHGTAIKIRKSLLTIPIHQSLTERHMQYIVRSVRDAIGKVFGG